jgi:phage terminase large subunit-like protein
VNRQVIATIDTDTKDWIRTVADDKAAKLGMVFDGERAVWVCDWIEGNCCLYEGDRAGEPMVLYDAQRDYLMRKYGWIRWSDEWGCWVRRFTHTSLWMAKKGGKSPTCAAENLYQLTADGEQGQKVYQMANTGKQARIPQMHSVNMVRKSPALAEDCKINGTTLDIIHLPTNSRIEVVTGNDRRGADSKHGYNGNVSIDEMHVVTRPMMDAVGRAGISRRQPLQSSYSTAGTDPSSVGFERCQYGRQVNSGERDDPHFLHVEYTADEKATDADIDVHLEEYGRAANPAWGTLIKPSEFKADWDRSKGTPRKVAIFKQERLSLWVGSSSPWLDQRGWENGKRSFTLADCAGRKCFLGFDAARKLDMTAAAFIFPWPEDGPDAIRLWPMFWLPEETAKERDHLFPFQSWAKAGDLTLTPGGTMDYSTVKADLRAAIRDNNLRVLKLLYDTAYANEITQALHEGESIGDHTEPGVVYEREEVNQGIMRLTGLACEFEKLVKSGQVQHPGNAVMTWQVGHVQVKRDRNQNIAPEKPDGNTGKNIDGIAAALDAMAGIVAAKGSTSVYESRGLLEIGEAKKPEAAQPNEPEPVLHWIGDDEDDDTF